MTMTMGIALAAAAVVLVVLVIILVLFKREANKRTKSINAIESRLKEMALELADGNRMKSYAMDSSSTDKMEELIRAIERLAVNTEEKEYTIQNYTEFDDPNDEISFDFLETEYYYDSEEDEMEDFLEEDIIVSEYNTGRSGKKYTAEELESLIKE